MEKDKFKEIKEILDNIRDMKKLKNIEETYDFIYKLEKNDLLIIVITYIEVMNNTIHFLEEYL